MGRKSLIVLLVFVVALVGIFIVADRVAASVAEDRIADQVAKEMRSRNITSANQPGASVGGFPFLTQVLAGKYDKVTVSVDAPQSGDVRLQKLTLVANDVDAPLGALTSGQGQVTAGTVSGTASMDWQTVKSMVDRTPLGQIPGLDVSQLKVDVRDNKLTLAAPIRFAGFQFTLEAAGTLTVANGQVRLQIEDVRTNAGGNTASLAQDFVRRNRDRLNVGIQVPALPYELKIDKVETSSAGVLMTATASQVVLAGAR